MQNNKEATRESERDRKRNIERERESERGTHTQRHRKTNKQDGDTNEPGNNGNPTWQTNVCVNGAGRAEFAFDVWKNKKHQSL